MESIYKLQKNSFCYYQEYSFTFIRHKFGNLKKNVTKENFCDQNATLQKHAIKKKKNVNLQKFVVTSFIFPLVSNKMLMKVGAKKACG